MDGILLVFLLPVSFDILEIPNGIDRKKHML